MKKLLLVICLFIIAVCLTGCGCKHEQTELQNAKTATCTENGYTGDTVCLNCKKVIQKGEVVAAPGHVPSSPVDGYPASCAFTGYTGDIYCKVCGELMEKGEIIEMTAHNPVRRTGREATCAQEGYTGDVICTGCGTILEKGESIPRLEHTPGERENRIEPTCTESGTTGEIYCAVCGALLDEGEILPAKGHTPGERTGVREATCLFEGYMGDAVCTVCGELCPGENTPALPHSFENNVCTECGWRVPGLYIDGQLEFDWDTMVANGYVTIEESDLTAVHSSLSGTLVVSPDIYSIQGSLWSSGSALENCPFTEVYLPNTVSELPYEAFRGSQNLEHVYLFSTNVTIEENAFRDCTKLASFTCKGSVVSLGPRSFCNCSGLKTIEVGEALWEAYPDSVFEGCSNLQTVPDAPKAISIGWKAFYNCKALDFSSINMDAVTKISSYAFCGVPVKEALFGESLTEIEDNLFWTDESNAAISQTLTSCDLSKTKITTLSGLRGCSRLEELKLPKSLRTVGRDALRNCTSLFVLELPEGVTTVENQYFSDGGSYDLNTIVWPSSLIDATGLRGLQRVQTIIYSGSKLQWEMVTGHEYFDNALVLFGKGSTLFAGGVTAAATQEEAKTQKSNAVPNTYQLFNTPKTYNGAKAYCESLGGHLVTITSQEEQDVIDALIAKESTMDSYFAGMKKSGDKFVKWSTGEPLVYTNFDYGEPNGGNWQDVLQIWGAPHGDDAGTWDDVEESSGDNMKTGFICEWETGEVE